MNILPMDYACLRYLMEYGTVPTVAIPSRIFAGDIPTGLRSLVELGLIEHDGDSTRITAAGRTAVTYAEREP